MSELKLDKTVLGHLAQKHESLAGKPIEEKLSANINRVARGELLDFLQEIQANLKLLQKVDLEEYEQWAQTSHLFLEHSPSSLTEVFPVSEDRHVDSIWNQIKDSHTEIATFLVQAFENAKGQTKKERARDAMATLQKNMDRFSGRILSDDDFEFLKKFQDMVEKFESVENIKDLNEHPKIEEILETVMSTQKFLCEILDERRKRDPEWFNKNEAVFGEIALFDGAKVIPSSRFLKLVLHNVGEYMLNQDRNLPARQILKNAFQEAIDANIFHQKVCIFSNSESGMVFEGVKDKVCPASNFLTLLVLREL